MRKITGAAFLSLDGVMQAPGGQNEDPTGGFDQGGWLFKIWDPGIAETLDWAAALLSLGARELSPEIIDETLGVVLKYEEDIRQLRGEQTKRMLIEVAARG